MRLTRPSWLWALLLALSACSSVTTDGGTPSPDAGTQPGRVTGQARLEGASSHEGITLTLEGASSSATTDADGRFTLENVPPGAHMVVARRAGYADARQPVQVPAGEAASVTLTLQRQRGGIQGTVQVEGLLDASGVSVTLQETGASTTSNSLGHFSFTDLSPGAYTVVLRKAGYVQTQETVEVRGSGAILVTIILPRERGSVAGVLQLEGASNHGGAVVTLVEAGLTATTNVQGQFLFENVMTGTYTVRARKDLYVDGQQTVEVRVNEQSQAHLTLALVRGDVTGTVQMADAASPSGVTLTVMETGATTTTDSQGQFSFTGLPLGTYTLRAQKDGYAAVQQSVTVRTGAPASVSFTLARARGRVEGTALLEGESNHAGISLSLLETGATATTDAQGRFAFTSVAAGTYTLEARRSGYALSQQSVTVREDQPSTLSFTLARERGGVVGVLQLGDGAVPVDITVTLAGTAFSARTDTSGQFSFSGVPTGTYTLEARKERYATTQRTVEVRAGEQTQVQLTLLIAHGHIAGMVLLEDAPTRSGISVALVQNGAGTTTDAQGRFSFNDLPTGTYTISAWWSGYDVQEQTVQVRYQETTNVTITLRRARGIVTGTLLLEGGHDHAGISVSLSGHDATATTDPQGHFVLQGVPEGHYTLTARKAHHAKAEAALEVSAGRPASVNQALARLGPLELSAPRLAVQGGHLALTGSGFGEEHGAFDITVGGRAVTDFVSWSDTRVVLRVAHALAPGEHDVVVTPSVPWRQSAAAPVQVLPQKTVALRESWGIGLQPDSRVSVWGEAPLGGASQPAPEALADVVGVAAATDTALVLLADGTVTAWGANLPGPLSVPEGLQDVVALCAGAAHALALKADGTVVAWGVDGGGQTEVPPGLSGVVDIAATDSASQAVLEDGTMTAWGADAPPEAPATLLTR